MAELNDKLITYGNLSTFYNKLQEQGLGGNAIEDVSVLPDASENKSKLFRLSTDDNVYVSELKSRTSTTTNRLPDAQQIDKAYLYEYGDCYYYKGAYKIVCSDGEIDGYLWGEYIVSLKNAETITQDSGTIYYVADGGVFDNVNKTITFDTDLASFKSENEDTEGFVSAGVTLIYATYNAPESAQIGNAFLNSSDNIYTGEEYTFTYNGVTYNGYKWGNYYASSKPASEIYFKAPETQAGFVISDTIFYSIEDEEISNPHTLYIQQLNAPDSEQVDNAYIVTCDYNGDDKTYKYTGEQVTIIGTNGTFTGYKWKSGTSADELALVISNTTANNIYCELSNDTQEIWLELLYGDFDSNTSTWDEGTIYTSNSISVSFWTTSSFEEGVSNPELSIVKYQRTEVTEVWDWEQVPTKNELNTLDESTFTGATLTVDGSQPSIVASGSTTIVWDDLASSIPSGKSVEVSVVLINTGNSALTPTISGNVQMMGDGNLTIQAGELGLYRGRYISALNKWLIEAIYQEVSGIAE